MRSTDLIAKKQTGSDLSAVEINWMITEFTAGKIPDYQLAALLMAIYFRGMNRRETVDLTRAMIASGKTADLSGIPKPKVDKHSTGGVGDKVSLIVAPIVASLGIAVPMISGRGLGHTGGTLDKLESIPGFKTSLSLASFVQQISDIGCALIGQTEEMVPADRKIYALRDVTCTVRSIPLITASILSKKVAEGAEALLLDVKFGRGAIYPEVDKAKQLALSLVTIGAELGLKIRALLTDMDQPLGKAVGNWLEVRECLDIMAGRVNAGDLRELSLVQAAVMLQMADNSVDYPTARKRAEGTLASGKALRKFIEIAQRQGGDTRYLEKPDLYPQAAHNRTIIAPKTGYICDLNALEIGKAAIYLGAGRQRQEDRVDPVAGIILHRKRGGRVDRGEPLTTLYAAQEANLAEAIPCALNAFRIEQAPPAPLPLILSEISSSGALPWMP